MTSRYTDSIYEDKAELQSPAIAAGEVIIGQIKGFNDAGEPLVNFPGCLEDKVSAISTVAITHEHKGRQVALLFANANLATPVILGVIYSPLLDILNNVEFVAEQEKAEEARTAFNLEEKQTDDTSSGKIEDIQEVDPFEGASSKDKDIIAGKVTPQQRDELQTANVDGERVVLEGREEVVLKCGEASITLTRAGKILIRGKYLLNRSSGVNRILGGSVQVN